MRLTMEERFWSRVDTSGGCWLWIGRQQGYAAALDAVRDAVAALPWDNSGCIDPVDALAAIDALRGGGEAPAAPLTCVTCGEPVREVVSRYNQHVRHYPHDHAPVSGEAPAAPGEVT